MTTTATYDGAKLNDVSGLVAVVTGGGTGKWKWTENAGREGFRLIYIQA